MPEATPSPIIRPALSPFDVELSPAAQIELQKNIEALNQELEKGNRGRFSVPLGHANAIKAAFELIDAAPGARRWHVAIVAVNPTFATLIFHADGEPEPTPGEPALVLLAQIRTEVAKLLGSIPVPNPRRSA
jgi:hypothetical protein